MLLQARGPVFFRPLDANMNPGVAFSICPDTILITPKVEGEWSHKDKCGLADVEDASGYDSLGADISFSFVHVEDRNFAFATLGVVTPAGSPGTVTGEQLPTSIPAGSFWFLGGKERHRNITGLTITGATVTTDYTLDADTGRVTFVTDQSGSPGPTADYGYTDPASVSMMSAGVLEYAVDIEYYNRQAANKKGSAELYRVRLNPADALDFMPTPYQTMTMKGKALADTTREVTDTEFGQWGRRIL